MFAASCPCLKTYACRLRQLLLRCKSRFDQRADCLRAVYRNERMPFFGISHGYSTEDLLTSYLVYG